jgi:hypothetical protein
MYEAYKARMKRIGTVLNFERSSEFFLLETKRSKKWGR